MLRPILTALVIVALAGCQSLPPAKPTGQASVCPDGRWLVANLWSFGTLPPNFQKEVTKMTAVARGRDTRGATNLAAYREDSVSRTMGGLLREEVKTRASANLDLEVFYRDPRDLRTARVVYNLGVLPVRGGIGSIRLPDDPHRWIVEVIWPDDFVSPIRSGGKNRLWVPPEDWEGGKHCTMNVHGIVP